VQQTDIPIAAVPVAEASQIRSTIPARTLREAKQIVSRIRHDYQDYRCSVAQTKIRSWLASKPKPSPSATPKRPAGGFGKTSAHRLGAKRHTSPSPRPSATPARKPAPSPSAKASPKPRATPASTPAASYPPEPVLPPYCPAIPGVSG
ncbi:MAG TPA: hypothetical protein VF834_20290, partial [Streptosporangiaceae bacterium]